MYIILCNVYCAMYIVQCILCNVYCVYILYINIVFFSICVTLQSINGMNMYEMFKHSCGGDAWIRNQKIWHEHPSEWGWTMVLCSFHIDDYWFVMCVTLFEIHRACMAIQESIYWPAPYCAGILHTKLVHFGGRFVPRVELFCTKHSLAIEICDLVGIIINQTRKTFKQWLKVETNSYQ